MFNAKDVLLGNKSWIGYISEKDTFENLPQLKEAVLNPGDRFTELKLDLEKQYQLNMLYAKDYNLLNDAEIMIKAWRHLDR